MNDVYIHNIQKIFETYKSLGERAMDQIEEKRLFWVFNNDSNSVAMIVQHLSGNMISRFTNFYDEDGEKPWRDRDREFETILTSKEEVMEAWNSGWAVFLKVIHELKDSDLEKTVLIRGEKHSVLEAINRQVAHYSYHIGQIVYLSKMLNQSGWQSLSIPKNGSDAFNEKMFGK